MLGPGEGGVPRRWWNTSLMQRSMGAVASIVSAGCVLGAAFLSWKYPSFLMWGSPRLLVDHDVVVVGAGLSGAVIADMYARFRNKTVLVVDYRDHIGGNCFDYIDKETGILMNKYGAHLFHTDKERVWRYVHRFAKWLPYQHRVIARVDDVLVPIPANINTVRSLVDPTIDSPATMARWLRDIRGASTAPKDGKLATSEDVAVGRVGDALYRKIFLEYTRKQWARDPSQLDGSVLSRIPVNPNWDDRYFPRDPHQAQPQGGFTKMFERMFDHPNITLAIGTDYYAIQKQISQARPSGKAPLVFFTGPIDQFFQRRGSELPPLQYRSIRFQHEVHREPGVVQPSFVVNYPQFRYGNFTRKVEYKHLYMQDSPASVVVTEFSTDRGEPYYPVPSQLNRDLYEQYKALAAEVEEREGVHFVGRLAQYKYFDMDDAIDNALSVFARVEGKECIDEMLETCPLQLEGLDSGSGAMVVDFVAAIEGKEVSRLKRCCQDPWMSAGKVKARWFVYLMDRGSGEVPGQDASKVAESLEAAGCREVRVRRAKRGWSRARVILGHMFESQFEFGGANVFLAGKGAGAGADLVAERAMCGLKAIAESLFHRGRVMASGGGAADVGALGAGGSNVVLDLSTISAAQARGHQDAASCSGVGDGMPDAMLHFLPLNPTREFASKGREESQKLNAIKDILSRHPKSFDRPPSFYLESCNFIATDAALRRMLQRHRTLLWDSFLHPADESFSGDDAFESLIYSLFIDVKQP